MNRAQLGLDMLAAGFRLPGPRLGPWLGAGLGAVAAPILRDRRAVALAQIGLALPALDAASRGVAQRGSERRARRSTPPAAGPAALRRRAGTSAAVASGEERSTWPAPFVLVALVLRFSSARSSRERDRGRDQSAREDDRSAQCNHTTSRRLRCIFVCLCFGPAHGVRWVLC